MSAQRMVGQIKKVPGLFKRALTLLGDQGPRALVIKLINRWRRIDYQQVFIAGQKELEQAAKDRQAAKEDPASKETAAPLVFSVVVPLYNTQPDHLTDMIASVQAQEYPHWQLCLADGSDQDQVQTIVERLAASDSRIHYLRLPENLGISDNTNAALAMASGDYIALLDHDDLLAPQALAEMKLAIDREGADLLYSDELNFSCDLNHVSLIHFKPDFAPDNLLSNNYICHLTVFSHPLSKKVGTFDALCDGSQDYDYILRLSEQAQKITHVPKVLYYWRIHGGSVASDISVKPYCLDAARLALANHLERTGRSAQIVNNTILSTYQTHFPLATDLDALVLVIVQDRQDLKNLQRFRHYPAGLSARWLFLVPAGLTSGSDSVSHFQDDLEATGLTGSIVLIPEGGSMGARINEIAQAATEKLLAFLTGQVQSLSVNWLSELARHALRPEIGLACGKITHQGIICQAGIATGIAGSLGGYHEGRVDGEPGYMARLTFVNNISAAEQTMMALSSDLFRSCGGFDEHYQMDLHDLDLALRLREQGLWHVYTPYAAAAVRDCHLLSVERLNQNSAHAADVKLFREHWQTTLVAPDPFYNPNFSQKHARFDQR